MSCSVSKSSEFFEAINNNDVQKVDALLTSGEIDVSLRNPDFNNRSALHLAAHRGRYDLVCLLVDKHKANVNIEDSEGNIPLQLATDRYHINIVKFLLSRDSRKRDYAVHFLNSDEIEEFFQAVEGNNIQKVTELLDIGVDVNAKDLSNFNQTALEVAATKGYYELVKVLVDRGADKQHEDDTGECAYHMALNEKHDNIANFLLDRGFIDKYAIDVDDSDN